MRSRLLSKAFIVGALAFGFIVPLASIHHVVRERARYREGAAAEIARSTARSQTLVGPVVVVRYREVVAATDGKGEKEIDRADVIMPDSLLIRSEPRVETRRRGIYPVPVYRAPVAIAARFTVPPGFGAQGRRLTDGPTAELIFGVPDPRGIRTVMQIKVDGAGKEARMVSGLGWIEHAFSIPLAADAAGRQLPVEVAMELVGTERLMFLPIGSVTDVEVKSDWPHPSFSGSYLPDTRSVSDRGFEARWRVSRFATGLDNAKLRVKDALDPGRPSARDPNAGVPGFLDTDFGVRFMQPVDVYAQSERAVKYGFLFVFLTFTAFFLFEVVRRLAMHPIQYILCGGALAIFFLLLLSLSEHVPFWAAYLIASAACVGLVGFYVAHALHSLGRGVAFAGLLGALYAALFVILQSEDYALLLGATLLFAALAIIMVLTRRVDWYRLSDEAPRSGEIG